MVAYIFVGFIAVVGIGYIYQIVVAPKKWMKQYGDGNYSPLRKTYHNAAKR